VTGHLAVANVSPEHGRFQHAHHCVTGSKANHPARPIGWWCSESRPCRLADRFFETFTSPLTPFNQEVEGQTAIVREHLAPGGTGRRKKAAATSGGDETAGFDRTGFERFIQKS